MQQHIVANTGASDRVKSNTIHCCEHWCELSCQKQHHTLLRTLVRAIVSKATPYFSAAIIGQLLAHPRCTIPALIMGRQLCCRGDPLLQERHTNYPPGSFPGTIRSQNILLPKNASSKTRALATGAFVSDRHALEHSQNWRAVLRHGALEYSSSARILRHGALERSSCTETSRFKTLGL